VEARVRAGDSVIENPRFDLLIANRRRSIVIVLAAIGVLALLATGWVAAMPGTETATQETDQETVASETTTSAVVAEDRLWDEGTELEESSVYIVSATPELTLTTETAVPTEESTVEHEVRVRHEAVHDESVFWEETESQSRATASVEEGTAVSEASIDVEALRDRRAELDAEFDGIGTIVTVVEVITEYETGTYSDELRVESPLETTEDAYWLEESLSESQEHSDTTQVEVEESPNTAMITGFAAIALVAFAGAAVVVVRGPIDAETARRSIHEHRYSEWISKGSIPMWVGDYHVALDTLEDVVDVAIDTNERVVHDEHRELFAVVNGAVVYYYAERGQWEGTAWPELELADGPSSPGSTVPPASGEPIDTELPDPDDDDVWEQI
jgi:hypothetical protein